MNRKKFAFSWGRKVFFGISWPLSIALGLIFFKSLGRPETTVEWFYTIFNIIGHYGLLNAIVYFFFFAPVIYLLPSYYVSRFWSLILILALNTFILLDGLSIAQYQLHLYSYIAPLYLNHGMEALFGSKMAAMVSGAALFVFAVLIWVRGESIWRAMQARFSNPIKNWYLLLIAILVIISKVMFFYSSSRPALAELFPLNFEIPKTRIVENKRTLTYPGQLVCKGKDNPNLVMIALKEWGSDQFNEEIMPLSFHMRKHGQYFSRHRDVSFSASEGLFSLFYSLPAAAASNALSTKPFFLSEMNKRGYEVLDLGRGESASSPAKHDEDVSTSFKDWADGRSSENAAPFFVSLVLNQHAGEADKHIQEAVTVLQKKNLLKNSYIVITGGSSGMTQKMIPLLYVSPSRKSGEVDSETSHYDLMPTIANQMWNCTNSFAVNGLGENLWQDQSDSLLLTGANKLKILDLKNESSLQVLDGELSKEGSPREELLFWALKYLQRLN